MRTTPVDYDYIDCIGVDTSFATDLNIFNAYNVTAAELESVIINQQLINQREKAYPKYCNCNVILFILQK